MILAKGFKILDFILGILEFPVIPQPLWGISIEILQFPASLKGGGKATEAGNSRILYDEIPRSSRGMTKNASRGMTQGLGILEFILY